MRGMKKLKHEAELFKGALLAGVKYAEGRKAVEFEPTDSASQKLLYIYRLLVEGYFQSNMAESVLRDYFRHITRELGLRTYGDPIIHKTNGQGKDLNEGYDAFVPLIDSGIYIAAWVKPRFLSTILYTCGEFDEDRAVATVRDFFKLADHQAAIF